MRLHPTPKISDEGLRGASKMMDDNLSVFGKIVGGGLSRNRYGRKPSRA